MLRVMGITDDVTTCECCGRVNLKCTVALDKCDAEGNTTGEVVHYGRDCASKALKGNNKPANVKNIEALARGIEYCRKWLNKTENHTARLVASACRTRHCPAWDIGNEIHFENGAIVR